MSTTGNTDTPSFEQRVQSIVSQATVDESGNLQLPEGIEADEAVLYAAKLEKQRRDTQSAFTKSQQQLRAKEAEAARLAEHWQKDALANLSKADLADLEELKLQDPEAWRDKINALEEQQRAKFQERRNQVTQEAQQFTELELREQQLNEFNQANPDFQITDEVIENDIPPRITKKLEKGEISFGEFLEECKKYISKPKKIAGSEAPNEPNLSRAPGGNAPSPEAVRAQSTNSYKNEVF